jgi:nitronate monooxygenase
VFEKLDFPVLAAPMAGGPSTPELVAAVSRAGGSGFLPAGYRTPTQLQADIARTREIGANDFGVNLFVPGLKSDVDVSEYAKTLLREANNYETSMGQSTWDDDHYETKLDIVVREHIPVVSFTFGIPSSRDIQRLHDVGSSVVITVTNPQEALWAKEIGADILCVQGGEAGGHRGLFRDVPTDPAGGEVCGLLTALRLIATKVDLPLIAAGGLAHGADIAAVLTAGACAAQLGTAFLLADEAGTSVAYRQALRETEKTTTFTRAFSGRPARGLRNRFIAHYESVVPAAYPQVNNLTRPIRAAAGKAGDREAMSLWAGQAFPLARTGSVVEIMAGLRKEFDFAFERINRRFPLAGL